MRFSAETGKATRIFYSIPGQLYKNASRYQVSGVLENGKIDRIQSILQDIITLAFWDKDVTENVIYQKLLSDKLSAYLGYVYENTLLLARLDFVGGGFDSLFHFVELFALDKHKIFVERTPLVDEQIVVGLADKHRAHLRSDADRLVG